MSNPLLASTDLPLFDRITPADVGPAIDALLARSSEALETVTKADFPAQWEAISAVLDVATEKLGTAWGMRGRCLAALAGGGAGATWRHAYQVELREAWGGRAGGLGGLVRGVRGA